MKITEQDIAKITLKSGGHAPDDGKMCLLEVVSLFSGEPFGDSPKCVDPALAAFGRAWNDGMRTDAEREQLKQYITRLPGTAGSPELSTRCSWMAFDWLVRVHLVAFLSLTPSLMSHADTLRNLPAIESPTQCDAALPHINAAWDAAGAAAWAAARDAAGAAARAAAGDAAGAAARAAAGTAAGAAAWAAAGDAAGAAARAAAGAAAGAAAWAAAGDAAGAAAWAAAGAAARAAAGAAAWDAAWDALEPTVKTLQLSAHGLFNRMIDLSK